MVFLLKCSRVILMLVLLMFEDVSFVRLKLILNVLILLALFLLFMLLGIGFRFVRLKNL